MDQNVTHARRPHGRLIPLLLGVSLIQGACSALPKGELSLDAGIKDRGVASWYGKEFHGKLAANGEVFDMTAFTAAHRKLPLGSFVRVLNLENGKSVHVRIIDRGPYVIGRMLDLSQAAAQALDMIERGTAAVQIEVIGEHGGLMPSPPPHRSSEAGVLLGRGPRPARGWCHDGGEIPTVTGRIRPHETLDVRRERRPGGRGTRKEMA
jgi:rare lipoprotein A